MSRTIQTALGESFELERHLPSIGWRPKFRGDASGLDMPDSGDDVGIFGLITLAFLLVLVIFPLLLFVAEVALVLSLIIPITIFALVVGLKEHTVVLRRSDGSLAGQRTVRGLYRSIRAGRELTAAAHAGAYR